ncbi:MAG: 4-amino-4-deoxy-L-arabinose-phospho-UDP flippase [Gammaproteobacteria bacterium]|nr:4-amino-4-deoxy-L-arabinose-phospho-UDP flippase [Gammaproteobacteria bacterium]
MTPRSKSFLYMGASILLSSVAQLSMKAGMLLLAAHTAAGWPGWMAILDNPALLWVGFGLACYGTSLLFWMSAIARLELSLAYPMLSLSYVLVYLVAVNWPLLHEHASWIRTAGIVVVVIGVILIAGSDKTNGKQTS